MRKKMKMKKIKLMMQIVINFILKRTFLIIFKIVLQLRNKLKIEEKKKNN